MNIRQLCYELYKVDWMQSISADRIADAYKNCYQEEYDSFEEYIFEFGYDGEIYVSYDEFLANEYHDSDYIKELLDDDELYQEYLDDIED